MGGGLIVYVKDSVGVRQVELPDSRAAFCAEVHRLSAQTGIVASVTPFLTPRAGRVRSNGQRTTGRRSKSRAR